MPRKISLVLIMLGSLMLAPMTGCSTAPKAKDRATFLEKSEASTHWFEQNVPGLKNQLDNAEAYIIFPDVAQWGIIFGGGKAGRGALMQPGRGHTGWGAVSTASIGLQAGVQGFRMLIVIRDKQTLNEFKANKWTGSVGAVAVGGDSGGSVLASFTSGMAVYTGANSGLMAGFNIGLEYIRYQPLDTP